MPGAPVRVYRYEVDVTDRTIADGGFVVRTLHVDVAATDTIDASLLAAQMTTCLVPEDHMVVATRKVEV